MADERWTRIETDVSETRSKVDALCTQVSTHGEILRALEGCSKQTATATMRLATLAEAREQREERREQRAADIEARTAERSDQAWAKLAHVFSSEWKWIALLLILLLQPGAIEVLRVYGLLPSFGGPTHAATP